jgi:hypothetical protein
VGVQSHGQEHRCLIFIIGSHVVKRIVGFDQTINCLCEKCSRDRPMFLQNQFGDGNSVRADGAQGAQISEAVRFVNVPSRFVVNS